MKKLIEPFDPQNNEHSEVARRAVTFSRIILGTAAMVNLSTSKLNDIDAVNIIREIDSKIHTMSLVHKKLYESRDLSHINLKEYLDELTACLMKFYTPLSEKIAISVKGDTIFLVIDIAIPLGMVLMNLLPMP